MKISHLFNLALPMSLYANDSSNIIALQGAIEALVGKHDVRMYGPKDSPIVSDVKKIAQEQLGIPESDMTISEDGKRIRIRNAGSLTLCCTDRNHTIEAIQDPYNRRLQDKELLDLAIRNEKANRSDVFNLHSMFYSSYLKESGFDNVLITTHMDASSSGFYSMQGGTIAEDGGPRGVNQAMMGVYHNKVVNGQLRLDYPIIAVTQENALGWEETGAEVAGIVNHAVIPPPEEEILTESAGYLLSLGRLHSAKGIIESIEAAKLAGKPLIIAGSQLNQHEKEFFASEIHPRITDFYDDKTLDELQELISNIKSGEVTFNAAPPIIYVGEADEAKKDFLYKNADVTLFLSTGKEAFGLVMIESMAYGTPVIGCTQFGKISNGSVDEVIDEGVTGLKVFGTNSDELAKNAADAITKIENMSREHVRERFDQRFHINAKLASIEKIYRDQVAKSEKLSMAI